MKCLYDIYQKTLDELFDDLVSIGEQYGDVNFYVSSSSGCEQDIEEITRRRKKLNRRVTSIKQEIIQLSKEYNE